MRIQVRTTCRAPWSGFASTSTMSGFAATLAMRGLAAILAISITSPIARADDHPFEGSWDTVLSCENAAGALGYSFKFISSVKDGVLHGEKGTKGKPGWLELDGKILPDGSANLYVDGLVGAAETAVGRRPAGTEYGYHVDAKFSGNFGTGKRVEGRPCSVEFKKKRER